MSNLENHVNHTKLDFSCEAGIANINVTTGRLLFERPDFAMGANTYAVEVSHIYDSDPNEPFRNANSCFGNGWKLNIQQSIYPEGNDIYYYVDSSGYTHKFQRYDSEGSIAKYYDETGAGLTLFVNGGIRHIEDPSGGRMEFNSQGRLTKIISSQNDAIKKIIEYSTDGRLEEIYDERKPNRKIKFVYGENDLLSKMQCVEQQSIKHEILYGYDNRGNLITVNDYIDSFEKHSVLYAYDSSNRLTHTVRIDSGSALRFSYASARRISKVENGIVTVRPDYDKEFIAVTGEQTHTGLHRAGHKKERFIKYIIGNGENDSEFLASASFKYNRPTNDFVAVFVSASTEVTNEKNVTIEYFLNKDGFTSGVLEKMGNEKYRTLVKDPGQGFALPREGGINEAGIGINVRSYTFSIEELRKYINADCRQTFSRFLVSFWVKVPLALRLNPFAKIEVMNSRGNTEHYARIDGFTTNWQYIAIPITIKRGSTLNLNAVSSMTIRFGTYKDADPSLSSVSLSNIYIRPNESSEMCIYESETKNYPLHCATKVSIDGQTKDIDHDFYMSEEDIVSTHYNIAYNKKSDGRFDLVYCDGTKRLSNISSVRITGSEGTIDLSAVINSGQALTNHASYAMKSNSPDENASVRTTVLFYYRQEGIEQATRVNVNNNDKGTERILIDRFDKTISEIDAYGVKTKYSYDSCGNPTKVKISNTSSNSLPIEQELFYDDDCECVIKTKQGDLEAYAEIDPTFACLMSVQSGANGAKSEFNYDTFKRLTGVKHGEQESNKIGYNSKGDTTSLKEAEGHRNKYRYNKFGDLTECSISNQSDNASIKLLEKEHGYRTTTISEGKKIGSAISERVFSGASATARERKVHYDEYGKIKEILEHHPTFGIGMTLFSYEEYGRAFLDTPATDVLKSITGTNANSTHLYSHDDENRICKSETILGISGQQRTASLTQTAPGRTDYEIIRQGTSMEQYATEIIYDENVAINPRIIETKHHLPNLPNLPNNEIVFYTQKYHYDSLGRLELITTNEPNRFVRYIYKEGTSQIEEVGVAYSSMEAYLTKYTYDNARGGIVTRIEETRRRNLDNLNTTETLRTEEYEYDDSLRLIKEVHFNGTQEALGRRCEYEYGESGKITAITRGTIKTVLSYDGFGRLTNNNRVYDTYGNPTRIGTETLEYVRGILLSKHGNTSYSYDYRGIRTQKVTTSNGGTASTTTNYYLDETKIIGEDRGNQSIRYIYDATGIQGMRINSIHYRFIKDLDGSIIAVAHSDGRVINRYIYSAYGEILQSEGQLYCPFRWKGQYYDTETGLYYIGGRYYDPKIGQFITPCHPEELDPFEERGLDRYSLTTAEPSNFTIFPFHDMTTGEEYISNNLLPVQNMTPQERARRESGWRLFWQGVKTFSNAAWETVKPAVSRAFEWYNGLPTGLKVGIGATAFAVGATASFACGGWSAVGAMAMKVAIGTAISAAAGALFGGIASQANGGSFGSGAKQGAITGSVEGFMWSSIFAAGSALRGLAKGRICFAEGTLVLTSEGHKRIEDIEANDLVWAYNEETGTNDFKPVTQLFR
ncbi:MAG: DUF6531 domain-containing protein, partial [Firmicutes bacterium]|nr:DUF6531 domain-containing protein [Bacillota bacterium]